MNSRKSLQNKDLLSDEVGTEASIIAKDRNIRKLVHSFQINCAYKPPKKFNGSCLDGRDITYKNVPDADFKFFVIATSKVRAKRRQRDLIINGENQSLDKLIDEIRLRDKLDSERENAPLMKAKDAIVIDTSVKTIDEQVDFIIDVVKSNMKGKKNE